MIDAAALLAVCRQLVDPQAQPITTHVGHNGTITLRAATTSGHVIVKSHRGTDRHQQEIYAYTHWTAALGDRAPRLLAVSGDPPAIVITALSGRPLADSTLTPAQEGQAHRQAGVLLRTLHNAGPPIDKPNMTEWLAERGEQWLVRAQHLLPAGQRADIRSHLIALSSLGRIPAVPCHLDYTPRNLMCSAPRRSEPTRHQRAGQNSEQLIVAAFDFEHARHDLAARDLVRLADRVWRHRPELEDAFLDGYGALSLLDREVIEHCTHLDLLTRIVRDSRQGSRTDMAGESHISAKHYKTFPK